MLTHLVGRLEKKEGGGIADPAHDSRSDAARHRLNSLNTSNELLKKFKKFKKRSDAGWRVIELVLSPFSPGT